jgi:hypothetical protein
VSDHLSCFTTLAGPGAFVCVGALSILGRFLDAAGPADGFGIRERALGRLCGITGLLIGLWLLFLAQAVAVPDWDGVTTLAPNAEKPATAVPGGRFALRVGLVVEGVAFRDISHVPTEIMLEPDALARRAKFAGIQIGSGRGVHRDLVFECQYRLLHGEVVDLVGIHYG